MALKSKNIKLAVSDKTEMHSFVARPPASTKKAPGIIVLQEAFGVNDHIRDVTMRFANAGFVAIACELFHRTAEAGLVIPYTDFAQAVPHLKAITEVGLKLDTKAAFDFLAHDAQVDSGAISVIGYCLGGRAAFVANSHLPLRHAISYYGGGIAPDLLHLVSEQKGELLLFWGGKDAHIGLENPHQLVLALQKVNKVFSDIIFSDADHGFFCDDKPVFNKRAASKAWQLTLTTLKTEGLR